MQDDKYNPIIPPEIALTNDTCQFVKRNNTFITNAFEHIPETIILNFMGFVILLVIYTILRAKKWDFGHLSLIDDENYNVFFYKYAEDESAIAKSESAVIQYMGYQWIINTWKIEQKHLFNKCGPDAANFLAFQKKLLFLMGITTLLAVFIVLPINYLGTMETRIYTFGRTTMHNLSPKSKLLWIHIFIAFGLTFLTVIVFRLDPPYLPFGELVSNKTILISGIDPSYTAKDVKKIVEKYYPSTKIAEVQMAFKVKKLMELERKRIKAYEAKLYYLEKQDAGIDVKVSKYGIICVQCGSKNAVEYFSEKEKYLTKLVLEERNNILNRHIGIAFITLKTRDLRNQIISQKKKLSSEKWKVYKAPLPSDVNWEYLELPSIHFYIKLIIINIVLCTFLFFLTTPVITINLLFSSSNIITFLNNAYPFMTQILHTLLIVTLSSVMPTIILTSDNRTHFWSRSKQHCVTMCKNFFLLLTTVVILPALGLTSLEGVLRLWTGGLSGNSSCIFMVDRGAYFIKYVIMYSLIGSVLDLLRFPILVRYAIKCLLVKTKAEMGKVRNQDVCIYPYYFHYARILVIYTMSISLSMVNPLITPFGLLYLALKYIVLKHKIFFVYQPAVVSGRKGHIHRLAIKFVYVSVIGLLVVLATFTRLKGDFDRRSFTCYTGATIITVLLIIIDHLPCQCSKDTDISRYVPRKREYVAPVLVKVEKILNSTNYEID